MDEHLRYTQLLAAAKRLYASGASEDAILSAARRAWPSPIQSIKVLRDIYAISLDDAKTRLHASPVWADQAPQWEALHAELEEVFARETDATGRVSHMDSPSATITLFRPVGSRELALIAESDFRAFPPRLTFQPIFYPVLTEAYAIEIARDWNTKDEASDYQGFVLRFAVDAAFASRYPTRTAGAKRHQELWIPAQDLEEFNQHIVGRIELIAEFKGAATHSNQRTS
jgi:hypothetical protein